MCDVLTVSNKLQTERVVLLCLAISSHIYQRKRPFVIATKQTRPYRMASYRKQHTKLENKIVSRTITEFDEIPAGTARGKSIKIFVTARLCV